MQSPPACNRHSIELNGPGRQIESNGPAETKSKPVRSVRDRELALVGNTNSDLPRAHSGVPLISDQSIKSIQ